MNCTNCPDLEADNESVENPGTYYCASCASYVAMEYGIHHLKPLPLSSKPGIEKISQAVDEFAQAIKDRMIKKSHDGYRGWETDYPSEKQAFGIKKDSVLIVGLPPHTQILVDIGARAMMLWRRRKEDGVNGREKLSHFRS